MEESHVRERSLALVDRSDIAILATIDDVGHPDARAVMKVEAEGLESLWFTTNTSSEKVVHLGGNPKACVYFVDLERWEGLTLLGTAEVLRDGPSRERLWREGFERYYPGGVNDPDYSVVRFTGKRAKYYHGLRKMSFDL
jgi:pyridoxamine 5'-phosphate oxidase